MKVWCIEGRDGWCACSAQRRAPPANRTSVRTMCRHYVILDWGIQKRKPTCPDCIRIIKAARCVSAER